MAKHELTRMESEWVNGSCVNGHQLGFVVYTAHCACGERSWGGKHASAKAWYRRHWRRCVLRRACG